MLTKMTLGEIVEKIPAATLLFRKYQLDFCYDGKKTLAEACKFQNLDVKQIDNELTSLEQVTLGSIWRDSTPERIVDHLENYYHKKLRLMVPELVLLAEKVELAHKSHPECPIGLSEFLSNLYKDLDDHMIKEETILFPMIRAGKEKEAQTHIIYLEKEHEEHGLNRNMLRVLAFNYLPPAGASASWKALYMGLNQFENELLEHVHLEAHILFKRLSTLK